MATDTRYNGWTNYATWRVNLEIFDGATVDDVTGEAPEGIDRDDDLRTLALALSEHAELLIEEQTTDGFARGLALAFLSDVNWQEIAEHILSDWEESHPDMYAEDAE